MQAGSQKNFGPEAGAAIPRTPASPGTAGETEPLGNARSEPDPRHESRALLPDHTERAGCGGTAFAGFARFRLVNPPLIADGLPSRKKNPAGDPAGFSKAGGRSRTRIYDLHDAAACSNFRDRGRSRTRIYDLHDAMAIACHPDDRRSRTRIYDLHDVKVHKYIYYKHVINFFRNFSVIVASLLPHVCQCFPLVQGARCCRVCAHAKSIVQKGRPLGRL